jgi:hypothetical protein
VVGGKDVIEAAREHPPSVPSYPCSPLGYDAFVADKISIHVGQIERLKAEDDRTLSGIPTLTSMSVQTLPRFVLSPGTRRPLDSPGLNATPEP